MSPAQLKKAQHKQYDAQALAVLRGEAGYQPAVKSPQSKSCKLQSKHHVSFT